MKSWNLFDVSEVVFEMFAKLTKVIMRLKKITRKCLSETCYIFVSEISQILYFGNWNSQKVHFSGILLKDGCD